MSINWQQLVRAVILFLFFLYIYQLHLTGDLLKLVNPKYETLSMIGAMLFLLLFFSQLFRVVSFSKHTAVHHCTDSHHHDHGDQPMNWKKGINYFILVCPLLTGFIFPLATLDASIARNKGATMFLTNQEETSIPIEESYTDETNPTLSEGNPGDENEIDPNVYQNKISKADYDQFKNKLVNLSHIDMNDVLYSSIYQQVMENPDLYHGKEITLTGFVYREKGFQPNQLVIGRFLITHCVADASLIGFLTQFDEEITVEDDTWMSITGKITITDYQGSQMPLIEVVEKEIIETPVQQYVYPLTIDILGTNG
ncbi:putative membrane protein [Gracilibacillus ureilyticus]|uniref:Putative membrane protein n=1 Tax=Gracilibacillus ureilyticus TaxID=531814 RepID=A0A1H9USX0_9BACI|nr:TIGR03943 family protein [Gracilibacillus ureilyticus]SES12448.1 putative membrane protein [Gracilibacillus ureilyticus]